MARPSRKRGNADYVSTSAYLPKRLNIAFDRCLLDLKEQGHQLDRSDVLAGLLNEWVQSPKPFSRLIP